MPQRRKQRWTPRGLVEKEREDGDYWRTVATKARAVGDDRYRGLEWGGLPEVLAAWVGNGEGEDTVFDDGG